MKQYCTTTSATTIIKLILNLFGAEKIPESIARTINSARQFKLKFFNEQPNEKAKTIAYVSEGDPIETQINKARQTKNLLSDNPKILINDNPNPKEAIAKRKQTLSSSVSLKQFFLSNKT